MVPKNSLTQRNTKFHNQIFDQRLCEDATFEHLDQEKLTDYFSRKLVLKEENYHPGISHQKQLEHFDLLRDSHPTYGTLLCFGLEPSSRWVSGAITRCIDHDNDNSSDKWKESKKIRKGLLRQYEESYDFIVKRLNVSRVMREERTVDQLEIPSEVLREALANALVHAEYEDRDDLIMVEIYRDRVEISNPGDLPKNMSLKSLLEDHKSHRRNPQIADIFYLYGLIEECGSGIDSMFRLMSEHGLPKPKFNISRDKRFKVTLYRPKEVPKEIIFSEAFGALLFQGIKGVAVSNKKSLDNVKNNIKDVAGITELATIEKWQQGFVPTRQDQVTALARICVQQGRMSREWLETFLREARYFNPELLIAELYPLALPKDAIAIGHSLLVLEKPPWCRWLSKITGLLGITLVFLLAFNAISTFFTSSKGVIPADTPFGWLVVTQWRMTLLVGCCLLLLAVLIYVLSRWQVHETASPSQQDRERILWRLHHTYNDLKMELLQNTVQLELELVKMPDAVQNATRRFFGVFHHGKQLPPLGTPITYNEAEHGLLILGEPGAGKSTLLLDLAQQLVTRAEQDEKQPLPVILPLSSWAIKRPPLQDWLSEQLTQIYDVPRRLSEWMREDRILPLLDGLDEMKDTDRAACIAAINAYYRDHTIPLVVCSRRAEYEAAVKQNKQPLTLQSAVMVQPLTQEQVDTHLIQAGKGLDVLRKALKKNTALQELATTPLMLNVLMLTYQGTSVWALSKKGAQLQEQVFTDYVDQMVERKGDAKLYPLKRTKSWLGWLACQMQDHNQTVFYLEHLQSDWLPTRQQQAYTWLAVRLPGILIGILTSFIVRLFLGFSNPTVFFPLIQPCLLGGFLGALFSDVTTRTASWQSMQNHPHRNLRTQRIVSSILMGLTYGLSFGLYLLNPPESYYGLGDWLRDGTLFGMMVGLSCWLLQSLQPVLFSQPTQVTPNNRGRRWQYVLRLMQTLHGRRMLLVAAVFGGALALSQGLSDGLKDGLSTGLSNLLSWGPSTVLNYGLMGVLISLILVEQARDVQFVDRLGWSWRSLLRSLVAHAHLRRTMLLTSSVAMLVGLSTGLEVLGIGLRQALIDGLSTGVNYVLRTGLIYGLGSGLGSALGYGSSIGLSYWLLLGLFQGIKSERIRDEDRRIPNQGIRHSVSNSLLVGVIIGIISGSLIGLSFGLSVWLVYLLSRGLSYGLDTGLSYGLNHGLSIGLEYAWRYGLIGLSKAWLVGCCGGLLAAASKGGLAALRHMVVRILLWRTHTFPLKAPQFLDDASRRILLRRIGGGYSFTHRLLLDYFADLYPPSSSTPSTKALPP